MRTFIAGLLWMIAPAIVLAQANLLPDAPEKPEVAAACDACHGIATSVAHKRSSRQWDAILRDMTQQGMSIGDDQRKSILAYLNTHFGQPQDFVPELSTVRGIGVGWTLALQAARTAQETCRISADKAPTVRVVDSAGATIVLLTGDGVSPITLLNSAIKVAAVLRFNESSGVIMKRMDHDPVLVNEIKSDPAIGEGLQGGVPILVNQNQLIGAIAVSGAFGPADKDEICARAALDKIRQGLDRIGQRLRQL